MSRLRLIERRRIDVMQVGADGLCTYYHVKLNDRPVGELFMRADSDLERAEVWFKMNGSEHARFSFATNRPDWLAVAHAGVADIMRRYWPGAKLYFFTGMGYGPVSERRPSLGGNCGDSKCPGSDHPRSKPSAAG